MNCVACIVYVAYLYSSILCCIVYSGLHAISYEIPVSDYVNLAEGSIP